MIEEYYIYRHLKPNGEVFYIGISKLNERNKKAKSYGTKFSRAFNKKRRSTYWKNKVEKYPNYEVQILKTGLTKEEACELETILISWYKRADCCGGTLVNLTDGGEGVDNLIRTEEHKRNISLALKNRIFSKEHCENLRQANIGKKVSEEAKQKLRSLYKGKRLKEENPFYGKKHSEENKLKWSESKRGALSPNARLIIDLETGVFYYCIQEACDAYNIKYGALRSMLQGRNKNRTNLRYC